MSRKLILNYFLFFLLQLPTVVFAQNVPLPNSNLNVNAAILNIINFIWPIFAGFSVIMFIWAGFLFLTAQGDPGKVNTARQAVFWGIIGIVVALLSNSILLIIKAALDV